MDKGQDVDFLFLIDPAYANPESDTDHNIFKVPDNVNKTYLIYSDMDQVDVSDAVTANNIPGASSLNVDEDVKHADMDEYAVPLISNILQRELYYQHN